MDSGNEHNIAEPSTGITPPTWERPGEASEHSPMRRRRMIGELSSLNRLELFGWDEA